MLKRFLKRPPKLSSTAIHKTTTQRDRNLGTAGGGLSHKITLPKPQETHFVPQSQAKSTLGWDDFEKQSPNVPAHLTILLSHQNKQLVIFGNVFAGLLYPPWGIDMWQKVFMKGKSVFNSFLPYSVTPLVCSSGWGETVRMVLLCRLRVHSRGWWDSLVGV